LSSIIKFKAIILGNTPAKSGGLELVLSDKDTAWKKFQIAPVNVYHNLFGA